jgi:hypothetical protein
VRITKNPLAGAADERRDAGLLLAALLVVPVTWWLALGWSAGCCVSGYDGVATFLLMLQELVSAHGDWTSLLYRADLFGGTKVRDAIGPFPPFTLFARLGLATTTAYNLSAWLVQALIAYLGTRVAIDLRRAWTEGRSSFGWVDALAGLLWIGFAPVLGWRFGYGHISLLAGALPFMAGAALITAASVGRLNLTLVAAAGVSLYCGLLFVGHQIVLYSATFGAPILIGLWWSLGRRPRAWLGPAAVGLCVLVLVAPSAAGVVAHATSSDSPRALGRMSLTYSYLTERWVDWLGSLLWTRDAIPSGQPELFYHETNVPFGPPLLLLALVPWRRARALAFGLGGAVVGTLLFSTNTRPFSTALIALIPPLNSFRVPTRAMLPAALLLPIVALAALGAGEQRVTRLQIAIGALAGVVLFVVPSGLREVLAWGVALAAVALARMPRRARWLPVTVVALALAGGAVGAFQERLLPLAPTEELLARWSRMGDVVREAQPALVSPLNRVSLTFELPEPRPNTAFAMGLSSLDGYLFPSRRFMELYCALRGRRFDPQALLLRFPPDMPWARALHQLYNVAWAIDLAPDDRLSGRPLAATAGAAWFSASAQHLPTTSALATALLASGGALHARAHEVLWVVDADPRVGGLALGDVDARCATARVISVSAQRRRPFVSAQVETPADCPVTFAMTYAESLRAEASLPSGPRAARVFPAYGALTGVMLPRGATSVRVEARQVGWP